MAKKKYTKQEAAQKIREIIVNLQKDDGIKIVGSPMSDIISPGVFCARPLFIFLADCLEKS